MVDTFNSKNANIKAIRGQKVPASEITKKKNEVFDALNHLAVELNENVSYLSPVKELHGVVGNSSHQITGSWLNEFNCEVVVDSTHLPPDSAKERIRIGKRFPYYLPDVTWDLEGMVAYVIESREGQTQKILQVTMNTRNVRASHKIPEKATLTLYLDGPLAKTFSIKEEEYTVMKDSHGFVLGNISKMIPGTDMKKLASKNIPKDLWERLESTFMAIACVGKFPEVQVEQE